MSEERLGQMRDILFGQEAQKIDERLASLEDKIAQEQKQTLQMQQAIQSLLEATQASQQAYLNQIRNMLPGVECSQSTANSDVDREVG